MTFGTTVAEPALIAVAEEASKVAAGAGAIASDQAAQEAYADGLRLTVAFSVGLAILGIVRWAVLLGAMLPLLLQRLGFDPATVSDVGTYEEPNRPAVGVQSVLVNGELVVAGGELLPDAAPGRPVRRTLP